MLFRAADHELFHRFKEVLPAVSPDQRPWRTLHDFGWCVWITNAVCGSQIGLAPRFRTFSVTEPALYHSLGKLPEPELNHRFL